MMKHKEARPQIADMIEWWTRDGGTFNYKLYIELCVVKLQMGEA